MKLEIKGSKVVATSESEQDALKLLRLGIPTAEPVAAPERKRRGRRSVFTNEADRKAHKRAYMRQWYRNKRAKERLASGEPVAIKKIEN